MEKLQFTATTAVANLFDIILKIKPYYISKIVTPLWHTEMFCLHNGIQFGAYSAIHLRTPQFPFCHSFVPLLSYRSIKPFQYIAFDRKFIKCLRESITLLNISIKLLVKKFRNILHNGNNWNVRAIRGGKSWRFELSSFPHTSGLQIRENSLYAKAFVSKFIAS